MLIFIMGGIGQNLQLPSDDSEILCVIRAPHKTYAYQILWQNMSYFASYGEKWVCQPLKNRMVAISPDLMWHTISRHVFNLTVHVMYHPVPPKVVDFLVWLFRSSCDPDEVTLHQRTAKTNSGLQETRIPQRLKCHKMSFLGWYPPCIITHTVPEINI